MIKLLISIFCLYLILLIPDCSNSSFQTAENKAFLWNMDDYFKSLESQYTFAKNQPKETVEFIIKNKKKKLLNLYNEMNSDSIRGFNSHKKYENYLSEVFNLSPFIAASSSNQDWFISFIIDSRRLIKKHSILWGSPQRDLTYKMLYGLRATLEEIALLRNDTHYLEYLNNENVFSSTPSTQILGIRVHSGDLLLSRGTVEVSAFISRGNDHPGNFSHVAIIHVDSITNKASLIEAHIEKGVAIANIDEYLKDKKFRFSVMRLNPEIKIYKQNPNLPHLAATYILNKAKKENIPYDFKMDFKSEKAMFCSEVVFEAYKTVSIVPWTTKSTISTEGTARWLHDFGIQNFTTLMPSDLEYDSQFLPAGEWYDVEHLFNDHQYNAVMDVLLEEANKGKNLEYSLFKLPLVRVIKAYCWILNQLGFVGIIPEGMSATQALKNETLVTYHSELREKATQSVDKFKLDNGYYPPYWTLLTIVRNQLSEK